MLQSINLLVFVKYRIERLGSSSMKREFVLRNKLKEARKEKKISQDVLSNMVGVSRNTICSIERYEYFPSSYLAYLLCKALEWKFEDLFYLENVDNNEIL